MDEPMLTPREIKTLAEEIVKQAIPRRTPFCGYWPGGYDASVFVSIEGDTVFLTIPCEDEFVSVRFSTAAIEALRVALNQVLAGV